MEWKDEFDEMDLHPLFPDEKQKIKDFISKQIDLAYEKGKKDEQQEYAVRNSGAGGEIKYSVKKG